MAPLISSVLPLISAGAAFAVSGGSTYSASGLPPAAAAVVAAAAAAAAAASANRTSNNSMLAGTTTTGALGSTAMAATAPLLLNWTIVAGTGAVLDAVMGADLFGPARHHSYVLPATVLGDMVELARWPVDLSALTVDDPDLDWRGILPLYREVLAVYDGKVYALPFNGIMQVMYYRRDVFEAAGLPPPRTWAEVQAAAARFNGTDLDGDGLANDFGVCIWQAADCERFSLPLTMLLASLVQARGRNSGLQMDPETGRMAHNTVAWETALQLLRNLSAFAPPPSAFQTSTSRDCLILTGFGEGKCAMTFTMAGVFKAFSSVANTASKVRGRMGMAPLPGSPVVLDWGRNELVPCNFDRCPYAVSYDQPENVQQYLAQRSEQQKQQQAAVAAAAAAALAAAAAAAARAANGSISQLQAASAQQVPNSSATASSSAGHHRRRQAQQQQQPQGLPALLANRAPFASAGGLSLLLNSKYSTAQQVAAYSIMVAMARSAASFQAIMTTSSSDGPTRMEHLDPANEGRWIAAGFHPNDTAQFLSAMRESIASGNTALDIRSRYARQYMRALTIATVMAANHSIPVPVIVRTSRALFDQTFTPDVMPAVLASYRASIRYINASAAGPAPAIASTDSASGAQRQSMLGVAVGVAVAGVVTLLALGAYSWWWTRRRRRPRDGGGRILAPGVGEGTSLVVTDILESTRLWEELPSAVMDMALQLHHGCIRRVSTATGGYESATEGDSFILAFHTPQAAVLFCLAAQEELARIVWPQELLQDDTCKPLWVRGAPKQQQQQQELSAHAGAAAALRSGHGPAARQVANPLARLSRGQTATGGACVRQQTGTGARSPAVGGGGGGGRGADSTNDMMLSAGSIGEGFQLMPQDSQNPVTGTQSGGSDVELDSALSTAAPGGGATAHSTGTGMSVGADVSRGAGEGPGQGPGEGPGSDWRLRASSFVRRGGGALSRSFAAVKRRGGTAISRLATGMLRGVGGGSTAPNATGGAGDGTGSEAWAFMHFRMPPSIIPASSRATGAAAASSAAAGAGGTAAARHFAERLPLPSRLEHSTLASGEDSGGCGGEGAFGGAGRGRSRAMLQIGGGGESGSDVDGAAAGAERTLPPTPTGPGNMLAGSTHNQQPSPAAKGAAAASSRGTSAESVRPSPAVPAQPLAPATFATTSPAGSLLPDSGRHLMSGSSSRRRGFRALSPLAPAAGMAGFGGAGAAQASAGTPATALRSGRSTTSADYSWGPGSAAYQSPFAAPTAAPAHADAVPAAPATCDASTADAGLVTSRGQPALVDDDAATAAALEALMLPLPSAALFEEPSNGASGVLSSHLAVTALDVRAVHGAVHGIRVSRLEGTRTDRVGSDQHLPMLSGSHMNQHSGPGYQQPRTALVVVPATSTTATGITDYDEPVDRSNRSGSGRGGRAASAADISSSLRSRPGLLRLVSKITARPATSSQMSSLPASGVPAAAAAAGTSHGARPLSTRTGTLHGASRAAGGGAGDAGGGAAGKGADRGPAAAVVMGVIGSSGIGALLRQRFLFTSDDSDTCKQPSCSPATAGQAIPEAVVPARPETRRPPRVSISADEAALQQRLGQAAAAASGGALDLSEPRGPTAGATAGGMRDPALISPWGTRLAATDRAASFSVAASGQAAMVASPGGGRSHGQGATGAAEPAAPLRLLMSGLRVRMGVASGVRLESDITLNRASQRTTYTGRTMAIAKAVSGAAAGGMVLVAAEAHVLLTGADGGAAPGGGTSTTTAGMGTAGILLRTGSSAGSSRNSFSVTSQRALFWAAGTYHLLESYGGGNGGGEERSPPPLDVYLVATPSQVPRWAALPPPAAGKPPTTCVAAGVLAAPVGQLALAVVTVSGAAAIAASSFGVWRQSANLLWREAARLAGAHGGFLATTRSAVVAAAGCDGAHAAASAKAAAGGGHTVLLTAAFPSAVSAMRWSAALLEWGLLAPWPAALLLHDCAEEIWRDDLPAVTAGAGTGAGPTKGGFGGRVCVAADAAPSTPAGAAAASAKTQSALPLTFEPPKQQARGSLSGSAARIAALRMPAGLSTEQQVSSSGLAPRAGAGVVNPALLYTGTVGGTPSQLSRASSLAVAVAVAPSSMLPAPQPALLGEGGADLGGNVLVSESALELPRSLNAALLSAGIRPASGHTALASGSSHSRGGARVRGLCSGAGGGGSTGPGSSNSTGTAGHATPPSRTQAPPGAHAASPSRVQAIDPLLASLPELDGFGAGATGGRNGSDMRQGASDVGTGGFGSRMLPQIPAELPVGGGGSGGGAVAAPALPPSNPAEAVRSNAHASPSASTHLTAATSSSVHCSTHSSSGQAGGSGRTGGGSGGRGSGFSTAVPGRMRRPTVLEVSPSLIPAGLEHHFLGGDVSSGAEGGGVQPQRTVLAVGRPRPAYPPDAGSTASGARASMDDRSSGYRTVVNQMQGFETGVRPGSRRSNLLSQPEGPAPIVLAECPGDAAAREDARDRTGDAGLGDAGAGSATILVEPAERLQGASPLPAAALAPEEEGQSITLVVGVSRGDPLQPLAQWSPSSLDEVTLAPPPVGTATAAVDTGGQPELLAQQPQRAAAWPYASLQTAGGSTGHGGAEAADQAQARAGVFQPVVLRTAAQAMCATTTQTVVSTLPSTAEVERPELHAEAAAAGAAAAQPQFPQHHSQQAGAPGANSSAAAGPRAGTPAAAADGPGGFPGRGVGVPLLPPPRPLRTSAVGSVRTRSSAHGGSSQLGFTSDGDGGVMLAEDFLPFFLCRGLRLRCGVDYGVATADVNCITGMVQYRGPVAVAAAALAARAPVSQVLVSSAAAATASAAIAAEAAVLAEDSISKARMLASPESVYLASRPPTVAQPAGSPGEITPQQ